MVENLLRTHRPRAMAMARRSLPTVEDAEDAVQEVSLLVYRKFHLYDPSRPFENWYSRIVSNVIATQMRKIRRIGYCENVDDDDSRLVAPSETLGNLYCESLIAMLPDADGVILHKMYIEEKSVAEVARDLDWSKTMLYRRLRNIRQYLRLIAEHNDYPYNLNS